MICSHCKIKSVSVKDKFCLDCVELHCNCGCGLLNCSVGMLSKRIEINGEVTVAQMIKDNIHSKIFIKKTLNTFIKNHFPAFYGVMEKYLLLME